jgi:biopolymer transport protein ExbD
MAELISSEKTSGRNRLKKMPVRIDLTAMVDLAFLLITFFILTTSLQKPRAMEIAMPVGPPGGDPASRTMTICLGKSNKAIWYLGMPDKPLATPQLVDYSKSGLRAALVNTGKKIFAATGKSLIVILKPSNKTMYGDFVSAVDELNITGVPSYAIAQISPQDVDLLKQHGAL